MESADQIWKVLLWGLGVCVSGFLFLAGWMWNIVGMMEDKVSHKTLKEEFNIVNESLNEIKSAIVGDYKNQGLLKTVDDNAKAIQKIADNCTRIQTKKSNKST